MDDFHLIYSTVMGELSPEYAVSWVECGMREDTAIGQAYNDFYIARENLCRRRNLEWEDPDLERIMSGLLRLEEDLARRMFLCGIEYAKRGYKL